MAALKVFLFGKFEVLLDGQGISGHLWQSRQVRLIFKYLIAMRGKPVSSSQILDVIWPDEDPETAQKSLYVRISQLRTLLKTAQGQDLIEKVEGGYLFVANKNKEPLTHTDACWIDVDEFERAADEGRNLLERQENRSAIQALDYARDLYRGDYLAEDPYQEWTIGERERLRDRYLICLTELAEAYAQTGLYRRAINVCRQILTIEPCREAVFMRLMLYYYYAGEKDRALQVYEQCYQVLFEELHVPPDRYTIDIARRIQAGNLWMQEGIPHYPPPAFEGRLFEVPYSLGKSPFSGREREYAWLVQQWRAHPRALIWIEGEAGVGKTRLVEEFVGYAAAQGAQVFKLRGLGNPGIPYATWIDAFRSHSEVMNLDGLGDQTSVILQSILTKSQPSPNVRELADPSLQSDQIKAALRDLLRTKIPRQGLFVVDDAHLLDESSIDLLSDLIGNYPILLLCRTEETPADHVLRKRIERIPVQPLALLLKRLSAEDVENLVEQLASSKIAQLADKLHSITQGNPLFLIATLQHLFEQGVLFVNSQGIWEQSGSVDPSLSPSIQETIVSRLQSLRPENRRILDVIAVAGGESNYELLRMVLGIEETALLANVDGLIEHGFLVEPRGVTSPEVALSHACYQEVVYQTLPKARRRIYHRSYGEAMLAAGLDTPIDAAVLAHHFHNGEENEKAVHYAKLGGDYAIRLYAPRQALRLFQDAESWFGPSDNGEARGLLAQLWMGMAEAFRLSGEYQQALTYYQKAMPFLKDEIKQAAAYQASQLQVLQGRPLSVYEDWAAEIDQEISAEGDSWALALFYWGRSFVALLRGKKVDTILHNARGWRVSRRLMADGRDPPYWVHQRALSILVRAHNQWANYRTSIHFSNRIRKLAEHRVQNEDANTQAVIKASMGESYYNLGEYQRAQALFQGCYDLAEKAGDPRLQGDALIGLGWVCFERGDFPQAAAYAEQVLRLVDHRNDIPRQVNARFLLAQIAICQTSAREIIPVLENFLQLARFQEAVPFTVKILLLLAEGHMILDQAVHAEADAREASEISRDSGMKRYQCAALRLWAQAKAQQNDWQGGSLLARQAVALAEANETPFEAGLALRTRANFQTDPDKFVEDMETALNLFESLGAAFEAGRTRAMLASSKTAGQD